MGKVIHLRIQIRGVLDEFPGQWVAFVVSQRDMERGYMIAHAPSIDDPNFLAEVHACRDSLPRWGGDVVSLHFSGPLIPPGTALIPTTLLATDHMQS